MLLPILQFPLISNNTTFIWSLFWPDLQPLFSLFPLHLFASTFYFFPHVYTRLAFEPVWRLRGSKHYARPSPPRRAQPPWPPRSRSTGSSWGWRAPPHTHTFTSSHGEKHTVRVGFKAQLDKEQECGVWLVILRHYVQTQEPLGSTGPLRQQRGNMWGSVQGEQRWSTGSVSGDLV